MSKSKEGNRFAIWKSLVSLILSKVYKARLKELNAECNEFLDQQGIKDKCIYYSICIPLHGCYFPNESLENSMSSGIFSRTGLNKYVLYDKEQPLYQKLIDFNKEIFFLKKVWNKFSNKYGTRENDLLLDCLPKAVRPCLNSTWVFYDTPYYIEPEDKKEYNRWFNLLQQNAVLSSLIAG